MAAYTLILGTKNWSSWSLRPYLAMRATGAPFEEIVIRLSHENPSVSREQILKYSPAGKVPVLKIAENGRTTTVWDSLAICETLAERHPKAKLWPDEAEQRALARSYAAEMHSGFPELRKTLSMDFTRVLPTPDLGAEVKAQIARIIEVWMHALSRAGKDGFLFGRFSIADCMYAPVVSRFLTYGIDLPPAAKAYCERVMQLPAMQDWARAAKAEVEAGWCD
ncbi:MAG: glutathione S-transferase family protein [Rhizomicrobium sp.]